MDGDAHPEDGAVRHRGARDCARAAQLQRDRREHRELRGLPHLARGHLAGRWHPGDGHHQELGVEELSGPYALQHRGSAPARHHSGFQRGHGLQPVARGLP
eukprot:15485806-Alexandrium_andersonii.AAC.1